MNYVHLHSNLRVHRCCLKLVHTPRRKGAKNNSPGILKFVCSDVLDGSYNTKSNSFGQNRTNDARVGLRKPDFYFITFVKCRTRCLLDQMANKV